ncbi:MAG: FAD-dependent oxidoreductase [Leptolyngbyaceae bacterium]|nr:FAD-dependent oxidoreductase [Leptolyngbyaceae bacterium]
MGTKRQRQLGRIRRTRRQQQTTSAQWFKIVKLVCLSTLWFTFSALTGVAIGVILGLMAAKPNAELAESDPVAADSTSDPSLTESNPDLEPLLEATPPSATLPAFVATALPQAGDRPRMYPQPEPEEEWTCEVVVIGGSLGGVAAATHAMLGGAQTCLIEVTPWFGGQISAQGVSAIDESWLVINTNHISPSWGYLLQHIRDVKYTLPQWAGGSTHLVDDINSCWVGQLCFPPQVGAQVALERLEEAAIASPNSRWAAKTAFKGADFDSSGQEITAIYAVRRVPKRDDYVPQGNLWQEIPAWYSWSNNDDFEKIPLRLVPPPGESMVVIDATDTGELVAWAKIPHRQGSESRQTTGEPNAPTRGNPQCTQAFTFPFALAIHDDKQASLNTLKEVDSEYNVREHFREYDLRHFPMFPGRSFFNYRRMISVIKNSATHGTPIPGDVTLVNWNPGNDWNWMNPPLILTDERLQESRQYTNWMGGLSITTLRHAESHALLFARWLIETQAQPGLPLSLWTGADAPMGTESGLSMMPYIREGRRILGRSAYGQDDFMLSEFDIRWGFSGYRDMTATSVAVAHYDVDIHGCRYRNWEEPWEAASAPTHESNVRPIHIPIESLVPQGVDNVLMGGKALAVTHIVNAVTRVHSGEWAIGGAAGAIAAWLTTQAPADVEAFEIVEQGYMPDLKRYLQEQGLQTDW